MIFLIGINWNICINLLVVNNVGSVGCTAMDEYSRYPQQSEQIIATIFTCRSIVRYNLTLNEPQKNDLLHDIDAALELLRSQLIIRGTTAEKNITAPECRIAAH
ncbi:hypothetical protein KDW_29620 [Dictyobacter vulcani]|uniref:Uncharacterized protein n=1 Tax=Dictyobacter vulcani TaxID=2607529 RepID=A0A5J4KQT1_9CHLR|nr:hypothetical protein [Dictyobacter vulcani]GER88800.1 hypothetical protein KDW_29620 [Dictyobacter vulcani]